MQRCMGKIVRQHTVDVLIQLLSFSLLTNTSRDNTWLMNKFEQNGTKKTYCRWKSAIPQVIFNNEDFQPIAHKNKQQEWVASIELIHSLVNEL